MKYEFTGETKLLFGITLKRIRATVSIESYNIAAGELGGWIESEKNLEQSGDAWVADNAQVCGDAQVYGDAQVSGNALVYGNARVCGDAQVSGNALVYGNAQVYGDARVYGDAQVYGNARVYDNAWEKSPLYIQGTHYAFYMATANKVGCGCQVFTFAGWHEHWRKIAAKFDMTEEEQVEYVGYFNLACERYGKLEFKIDLTDGSGGEEPTEGEVEDDE